MSLHIGDPVEPRSDRSPLGPGRIHSADDSGGLFVMHLGGEHIRWTEDQLRAVETLAHAVPHLVDGRCRCICPDCFKVGAEVGPMNLVKWICSDCSWASAAPLGFQARLTQLAPALLDQLATLGHVFGATTKPASVLAAVPGTYAQPSLFDLEAS